MATKKASKNEPKTITLTREQIFDIVDEAYGSGFCEGRRSEKEENMDITGIMGDIEEKYGKI